MRDLITEKSIELEIDLSICSEEERIIVYGYVIEQIQVFLDSNDLRIVTGDDIRDIERGISTIINWLNRFDDKSLIPIPIRKPILKNIRNARKELFNALDNENYTEKNRRIFYGCLTKW